MGNRWASGPGTRLTWAATLLVGLLNLLGSGRGQAQTATTHSPRLGIDYEWVRFSNGALGVRLVADAPPGSPLAVQGLQLERGDIITALDGVAVTTAEEMETHHSQTSVSFVNVRTGQQEARWANLPPPAGATSGAAFVSAAASQVFRPGGGVSPLYGAIAYSQSTHSWGTSWGHPSRAEAEEAAMERCKQSDAFIAAWGRNTWLALANGQGTSYGWSFDDGDEQKARGRAVAESAKRGAGARVATSFYAGGKGSAYIKIRARDGARVFVGTQEIPMIGGEGSFTSPSLLGGTEYQYVVSCSTPLSGATLSQTATAIVSSGKTTSVSFGDLDSLPAADVEESDFAASLHDPDPVDDLVAKVKID